MKTFLVEFEYEKKNIRCILSKTGYYKYKKLQIREATDRIVSI
jgi:hypothetical protein